MAPAAAVCHAAAAAAVPQPRGNATQARAKGLELIITSHICSSYGCCVSIDACKRLTHKKKFPSARSYNVNKEKEAFYMYLRLTTQGSRVIHVSMLLCSMHSRECQYENTELQPFPKWHQFCNLTCHLVEINNIGLMTHKSTSWHLKFVKLRSLCSTKLSK